MLATIVGLSVAWQDASGPGALADIDIPYQVNHPCMSGMCSTTCQRIGIDIINKYRSGFWHDCAL